MYLMVVLMITLLIPATPCQAGKKQLEKAKKALLERRMAEVKADSALATLDLAGCSAQIKYAKRISLIREYLGMAEPKKYRVRSNRTSLSWNTTAYYQAPVRYSSGPRCSGDNCSAFQ